jgi:hypothetical protein
MLQYEEDGYMFNGLQDNNDELAMIESLDNGKPYKVAK